MKRAKSCRTLVEATLRLYEFSHEHGEGNEKEAFNEDQSITSSNKCEKKSYKDRKVTN